jgi:hypothetical protein
MISEKLKLIEKAKVAYIVYAVVEDSPPPYMHCIVKTLWTNRADAEKYADASDMRVVNWAVLHGEDC